MAEPETLVALADGPADEEAPVYIPVPAEMTFCADEEGALGMFFASLLSGTEGLAKSAYQLSRRLALYTTLEGALYVQGLMIRL